MCICMLQWLAQCISNVICTHWHCRSKETDNYLLCCWIRHSDCDCWNCHYLEMEGEQSTQTSIHDPATGRTVQDEQGPFATYSREQQSLQESDPAARSPGFSSTQSDYVQTSGPQCTGLWWLQYWLEVWYCSMAETGNCNDKATGLTYSATDYIECILFCMNIAVDQWLFYSLWCQC